MPMTQIKQLTSVQTKGFGGDKRVLLVILDGWGEGLASAYNPIHLAQTPTLDSLRQNYPFCLLQASGIAVGLPWQEPGNSEVGHLTIGAGRVYYKNYPRINLAIQDKSFFENEVLKQVINHAKTHQSRIHLVGLLTQGVIHAAFNHLIALLDFFSQYQNIPLYLHLFLDGRDSPPQSGLSLLKQLESEMRQRNIGKIASLCGRSYGLDKNEYWEVKTQRAFKLIIEGIGRQIENYADYLTQLYQDFNFTDEDLEPLLLDATGKVSDGDAVFCFNFRSDGMAQLMRAFLDPAFSKFPRPQRRELFIGSMTQYLTDISYPVAFPPEKVKIHLTRVVSDYQLKQIKIAEKAKAAHLTYFFNGLYSDNHPNEFWRIFPPSDKSLSENPLMQSEIITKALLELLGETEYSLVVANYAAPDIVAHTGNFNLCLEVAEKIDKLIGLLVEKVISMPDWVMVLTADHGNLEEIMVFETGERDTSHNNNPVPFYVVSQELYRVKTEAELRQASKEVVGILADVAPTILTLMGLPIPPEMTGKNILPKCL